MGLAVREIQKHAAPGPIFVIPGEHDTLSEESMAAFIRWFGAPSFDFRIGRTRFLGLNNARGPLDGKALTQLKEKLEQADAGRERVIVCLHRNVVGPQYGEMASREQVEAGNEALIQLVRAHKVPYVLSGHYHRSYVERRGETQFVIVPTSGHRRIETDQARISYMILHWTGESFTLRREQFYRTNLMEIEGAFLRLSLGYIAPLFEKHPFIFYPLTAVSLFTCALGLIAHARRKRHGG